VVVVLENPARRLVPVLGFLGLELMVALGEPAAQLLTVAVGVAAVLEVRGLLHHLHKGVMAEPV
jgi:hypothetical protein